MCAKSHTHVCNQDNLHFRVPCKVKMGAPCSKVIKSFKMATGRHQPNSRTLLWVGPCVIIGDLLVKQAVCFVTVAVTRLR